MKKNKFYITTPIYYSSGKAHVGTLFTTVIADVIARWRTLNGDEAYFLTGLDEHGQKIAGVAEKAGKTPQQLVDEYAVSYKELWHKYEIAYTHFIRTTDAEHKEAVHALIKLLIKNGDIYRGEYHGWYCTPDEAFAQSAVPADQPAPLCPLCGRQTHYVSESCYFFKLSAYQDKLLAFFKANPDFILPKERSHEVIAFVESGLKDLSISRSTVKWGIPFPDDPEQVVYVWLDALTNYISAIGFGDEKRAKEFEKWWPADLHILAKDIVRFHAVYWIAFLMAADLPLPKQLLVHGWITVSGQKMSKSLGNAADPQLLLKLYGADPVRYYLTSRFSMAQDGDFSIEDLEHVITQDLANELGNLLNRVLVLAHKHAMPELAPVKAQLSVTKQLRQDYAYMLEQVQAHMSVYNMHLACAEIKRFVGQVNAYVHALEPWRLADTDKTAFIEAITTVAGSLYAVAHLLWPIMPVKMEQLCAALGKKITISDELSNLDPWNQSFVLAEKVVLFEKVDGVFDAACAKSEQSSDVMSTQNSVAAQVPVVSEISIETFSSVCIVTGTIVHADIVEKSDKLLKLKVNCGPYGERQILAGIRAFYKPETLVGQQGLFVVNLKPRMLMGLESQGMLLCVPDGTISPFIQPHQRVADGLRVK